LHEQANVAGDVHDYHDSLGEKIKADQGGRRRQYCSNQGLRALK